MKITLYGILMFMPLLSSAQDQRAFQRINDLLASNARHSVPATWEGSERLRTLLTQKIATTKDSIAKADLFEYRALNSLKQGDYDLAHVDYEAAVRLSSKAFGGVGWRYLFLFRDYQRALTYLNMFDARTPNYDDPIDDYSVNYLKGRAYAGLRQDEQAIAAYTIAITQREKRHGTEWIDYRYFVARAVSYLAVKQFENAVQDLDKALKNNPKSAMANYHRGRALKQLGRATEARDAFSDALFYVRTQPFERDYYYEQPDAAYENQIESALKALKP